LSPVLLLGGDVPGAANGGSKNRGAGLAGDAAIEYTPPAGSCA